MSIAPPIKTRTQGAYRKSYDYQRLSARNTWGNNKTHNQEHVNEELPDRDLPDKVLKTTRTHVFHLEVGSGLQDYLYSYSCTRVTKKLRCFGGPLDGKRAAEWPYPEDYKLFRGQNRPEPGADRWVFIHKDKLK